MSNTPDPKVEIENLFDEIEKDVRALFALPYSGRKQEEKFILQKVGRIAILARSLDGWHSAANFSGYMSEIRDSLREICKPKTKYYQGDDYNLVSILSAFSKMGHPTCLNLSK